MKKLKLKVLELGAREVLTREQLKKMVGGDADGSGGPGHCQFHFCTDQHTNCNDYVESQFACNTASNCNSTMATCGSGLYWSCF